MTSPGVGRGLKIVQLAEIVQAKIVSHYATAGADLPTNQFFLAGDPAVAAWDCEQFTIGLSGVGWGWAEDNQPQTSPQTGTHFNVTSLRHVVFAIQIVRCTPSAGKNGIPTVAEIDTAGRASMKDAGLLSQALVMAVKEINQQVTRNEGKAQAGAIVPAGPEGKYHAITGTLSVTAGNLE